MNSGEELAVKKDERYDTVGGEIHIFADKATGEVRVNAPQNLLVALGILETAKAVLIQQHMDAQRRAAMRQSILRAGPADVPGLVRAS